MSVGSDDLIEIYRAGSLPEAHALGSALEREGIAARIDNEALQGAVGGIAAGWATSPRVLVGSADEAAARAVLEKFLQRAGGPAEGEDTPMRCLACGAPMGEVDVCPACGWSYGSGPDEPCEPDPESAPVEPAAAEHKPAASEPGQTELPPPRPAGPAAQPALAGRAVWAEIGAVLAVGVVPSFVSSVAYLAVPPPPLRPYWIDALETTVLSGCTIFVTLYLIHRSGEPWTRFGLTRPRLWDALLGMGLFLATEALWLLCCGLLPWNDGPVSGSFFSRPRQPVEYVMMVLRYGAAGFEEELVSRAYLITRFESLLRSRVAVVLLPATLFAACHGYLGTAGVASAMMVGVLFGVAFLLVRRVWPLAIGHAIHNIYLSLAT